ncbi:MAG TPA: N-acetyl-gamma-glutamyl-phosphate reductase [Beijerinckiaceae bacterium]|nr:N-acetyl-gamma-glutamyl-phosphate reductase [Beijerinckiaceae bacterium]
MAAKVFIDGEAGTTGLLIRDLLGARRDVDIVSIDPAKRKDVDAKRKLLEGVDLTILCLPDDAAKESAALATSLGGNGPKVLDASTAHRVAPNWVYGFPELAEGQAAAIAGGRLVANPGCYATGAIALLRPLVDAQLLPSDHPITINAVSGYSGGGKSMIAEYEARTAPEFELYGLGLQHKHMPEIQAYSRLSRRAIFVPSVADFRQGMLVSIPLHLDTLPGKPKSGDLEAALTKHYAGARFVKVVPAAAVAKEGGKLEAEALNDTNDMELRVISNEQHGQVVLIAKLDNLGKGASRAAVQNMELMLGL